jgi:hypothetical protein
MIGTAYHQPCRLGPTEQDQGKGVGYCVRPLDVGMVTLTKDQRSSPYARFGRSRMTRR